MSTLFQPGLIQPGLSQQPGGEQSAGPLWYLACFEASATPTWNRADTGNGRNGWSATGYVTSGTGTAPSSGSGDDASVGITLTGDFSGGPYKLWLIWDDGTNSSNLVSSDSWSAFTNISSIVVSQATLQALLTTAITLQTSSVSIAASSGVLTTVIYLSASSSGQAQSTASLTAQIALQAQSLNESSASANVTTEIKLASSVQSQSSLSGDLYTSILFYSNLISESTASANLFVGSTLQASLYSESSLTGNLTSQITLQSSLFSYSNAFADLTTEIKLLFNAYAESTAQGDLYVVPGVSRPITDVLTTGWTVHGATDYYDALNEESYEDTDYIQSPDLDNSQTPVVFEISPTLPAGDTVVRIRAKYLGNASLLRIVLQDALGATVGTSTWKNLSDNFYTYEIPVTITDTASRVRIEVQ